MSLLNRANEVFVDTKLLADLDRTIRALTSKPKPVDENERAQMESKLLTLRLARATAFESRVAKRIDRQHEAMATLRELDTLTTLAAEQGAILPKQQKQIAELVWDTRNLLGAWIRSDRKRYNY